MHRSDVNFVMMSELFKLNAPFQPAGHQPESIDHMVQGIRAGYSAQTLLGVTGSGKTFTMAKVIEETNRPALVLAPNKTSFSAQRFVCRVTHNTL